MEKQNQLRSHVGRKRQRQTSLSEAVSEPKNVTNAPNLMDTLTKLYLVKSPLTKSHRAKLMSTAKNIISESTKFDGPQLTKEKAKITKEKPTTNIQVVESKKQKHVKHIAPAPLQPKTIVEELDTPKKKKKKSKDVVVEVKNPPQKTFNAFFNVEDKTSSLHQQKAKYPVLNDKELIERFLKVPMSNNQKGRIRQAIRLSLLDTTNKMFPDIINGKIQAILQTSKDLTDSELRRIRILHNMLKTALETPGDNEIENKPPKKKNDTNKSKDSGLEGGDKKKDPVVKVKGPKRYVVFLGNLPLDINKEMIMNHFKDLSRHIKDIRLPKRPENTKSAIAYMELSNEPGYELALSKHHSMMGTKRIRVLYTTQQNSKISKSEAKGKSAKLIALQKSGKLIGSIPLTKKRSHRRAIMKKALANQASRVE